MRAASKRMPSVSTQADPNSLTAPVSASIKVESCANQRTSDVPELSATEAESGRAISAIIHSVSGIIRRGR